MARTVDPVKHAAKRASIRDAAAGVFAERGYDGASTEAIRRAAQVGSGTLFHYFGDKRSLMVEIFEAEHAANDVVLASLDPGRPVSELWRLLDHLTADATHPIAPGLVVAMLQLATRDQPFAELLETGDARVRGALADLVRAAQQQGTIDGALDPTQAARWLLGLVDTLFLMVGDEVDPVAETAELRRVVARYLGCEPSS